jgi:hypothetical protein
MGGLQPTIHQKKSDSTGKHRSPHREVKPRQQKRMRNLAKGL